MKRLTIQGGFSGKCRGNLQAGMKCLKEQDMDNGLGFSLWLQGGTSHFMNLKDYRGRGLCALGLPPVPKERAARFSHQLAQI